jgi:hypothetical protein
LGTKEEMVRPNTLPVIAGMADIHASRDASISEFPTDSVGTSRLSLPWIELAVPLASESDCPIPTGRSLLHVVPESSHSLVGGKGYSRHGIRLSQTVYPEEALARLRS